MICLSLGAPTLAKALHEALANSRQVEAFELRGDLLNADELSGIGSFPRMLVDAGVGHPVILTIRRSRDGGRYGDHEADRASLLKTAIGEASRTGSSWFALDLEEDFDPAALREAARNAGVRVIRSIHDARGVPADLEERLGTMARDPSEILKAVVRANSTRDLYRLCNASIALGSRPRVILGTGEFGLPSRILAGRLGSMLTFCSIEKNSAAPDHIDPDTLGTLYRYRALSAATALFCVIGNPVMHSRSPHYHNGRFRQDALDAVYFPVQVDDVDDFFALAGLIGIRGASVTIPHKAAVIPYLASSDAAVREIGACNTLLRRTDGWHGANTDVSGFIRPLLAALMREDLNGVRAGVIGAGGAARGVVYALLAAGASVSVLNRTPEKAAQLAGELGPLCREGRTLTHGGLDRHGVELLAEHRQVIVQTTSVGMHPNEGVDPFMSYRFQGDETVCDIIYTPERTAFLMRAEKSGCRILTGRAMFEQQAAEQYSEFRRLAVGRA